MDTIEINTELEKINKLHHSLDENNIMTFIIFLESNRVRLSNAQIDWVNDKIDRLTEKQRQQVETACSNIDIDLARTPLLEKVDELGQSLG
jgi:hypothetical protein